MTNLPFCATHAHQFRKEAKDAKKVKVVKTVRKVSEKRANEEKAYQVVRAGFLATHYYCAAKLEGCTYKATDVHHSSGREGKKLTDVTKFIAVCRNCHSLLHDKLSAAERRDKNLLI